MWSQKIRRNRKRVRSLEKLYDSHSCFNHMHTQVLLATITCVHTHTYALEYEHNRLLTLISTVSKQLTRARKGQAPKTHIAFLPVAQNVGRTAPQTGRYIIRFKPNSSNNSNLKWRVEIRIIPRRKYSIDFLGRSKRVSGFIFYFCCC